MICPPQYLSILRYAPHPIFSQPGLWLHRQKRCSPIPPSLILLLHIRPIYRTTNADGPPNSAPAPHAPLRHFQSHLQIFQIQTRGKLPSHQKSKLDCANRVYHTHISTLHHHMKYAELLDKHLHLAQKFLPIPA